MNELEVEDLNALDNVRAYVKHYLKEKDLDSETVSLLESGLYNSTMTLLDPLFKENDDIPINDFLFFYKQKFMKVFVNFHKETILRDPYNFVSIDRSELSDKWSVLEKNRTENISRKKGAHKCPRCKSWYTEYVEIQTRSADEAATIKISCECGHRWMLN
jgi:DNA-directed RNA polymerase subunit M/transcription elongation factor TFIIS